jgi:hypothetical protein
LWTVYFSGKLTYGLLHSEVKVYEIDCGNGRMLKQKVVTKKMSMQSKNVVRHLYSVLEPIYRLWLTKEHVAAVLQQKWVLAEEVR